MIPKDTNPEPMVLKKKEQVERDRQKREMLRTYRPPINDLIEIGTAQNKRLS